MARMLSESATRYFGCCSMCARNVCHDHKPQRRTRRQARAVEKRTILADYEHELDAADPYPLFGWECPTIGRRCPDECGQSGRWC